ncbi:hypothetical protein FB451DRAFT_1148162 [Mycena latifolia]|nr:hypothetical protein FB451DRAFT_1148162 [Mycena latifolia]
MFHLVRRSNERPNVQFLLSPLTHGLGGDHSTSPRSDWDGAGTLLIRICRARGSWIWLRSTTGGPSVGRSECVLMTSAGRCSGGGISRVSGFAGLRAGRGPTVEVLGL